MGRRARAAKAHDGVRRRPVHYLRYGRSRPRDRSSARNPRARVAWLFRPLGHARGPAAVVRGADPLDLSGVHGREGRGRAGSGAGGALPARVAGGTDVLSPQARRSRGPGGGGPGGRAGRGTLSPRPRAPTRSSRRSPAISSAHARSTPAASRCPASRSARSCCSAPQSHERLREAALAAGAPPPAARAPEVLAALGRFGRMAGVEVEAVCDLPGPRANAELWRLAAEWRVKPVRVLTGMLWELP